MLIKKGRLNLKMDPNRWIEKVESLEGVHFIPVDNDIATQSVHLPGSFHEDPADRIIVATAIEKRAQLITADQKIRDYKGIDTFWG